MAVGVHTSALGLGPPRHCLIILLFLQNACSVWLPTSLFLPVGCYGLLPSLEVSPSQSQFLPRDQLNKHLRQFLLSGNSSFHRAIGWLPAYYLPQPCGFQNTVSITLSRQRINTLVWNFPHSSRIFSFICSLHSKKLSCRGF